ncbi:FeoA family protein [Corynebacterium auriscanis]|uniref:FeoA family protein n=1 Tax=Corynebacterium auriscanis TaxID=99807 RepID=UPI0024AE6B82|nr:FeoA family protein [Corynebacterium auriscanis]
MNTEAPTCLTQLGLNCTAHICSVDDCAMSRSTCRRLAELGLRPGQSITVVQKIAGGGRIVKASSVRYALDKQLASAIQVRTA